MVVLQRAVVKRLCLTGPVAKAGYLVVVHMVSGGGLKRRGSVSARARHGCGVVGASRPARARVDHVAIVLLVLLRL